MNSSTLVSYSTSIALGGLSATVSAFSKLKAEMWTSRTEEMSVKRPLFTKFDIE